MNEPRVTYGQLADVLNSFGFERKTLTDGNYLFEYPGTNVVVSLPSLPRDKAARPFHWMKVRGTLDDFGFLDRDKFFDAVRERSPAA